MRKIYKITLDVIGILLIFSLMITASYLKYKNNLEESALVLVENGLSINYLDGNTIQVNGHETSYNLSITNNTEATLYYYIEVNNISSNKDDIGYSLLDRNNKINKKEEIFPLLDTYIISFVEIEPGKTDTYTLTIEEKKHSYLNATIKVGIEDMKQENFASTILAKNEVKKEASTKIGEEASIENEGLIETTDDYGTSYYFRGAISNNYVSFADLLWRIVKINGDGSIKLILNDYIEEMGNFYNLDSEKSLEEKLTFSKTNIYTTLEQFFQSNLVGYEKYLVSSKYCLDDSVGAVEGENTYYLGYSRLLTDYNQTYSCLGKVYNSRIGLLTADEAVYAGANKNSENASYYLYVPNKEQSWWTMTPASSNADNVTYFEMSEKGKLENISTGNYYRGIRPVINLAKRTFAEGEGTLENPYILTDLQ